jgi:hypothetical protein
MLISTPSQNRQFFIRESEAASDRFEMIAHPGCHCRREGGGAHSITETRDPFLQKKNPNLLFSRCSRVTLLCFSFRQQNPRSISGPS